MARPKNKSKFHLITKSNSQYWYVKFFSEKESRWVRKSTGYSRAEYTKEQVQRIIDNETGTKAKIEKHSINWLSEHILYRLGIEDRSEKTTEGYEIAFRALTEIYGGGFSIHKIDRSAIWKIKSFLQEKGNRPATINTCLRKLRAAFERLFIDEVIPRNPFYRFESMKEDTENRQKAFTLDELKRLLDVLATLKNEKLRRLLRISIFTAMRRSELLYIDRSDVNLDQGIFEAINNKSRDLHKVLRQIPEEVWSDFRYFMESNSNSQFPFRVYQPNSYTCMTKKMLKKHGFNEDLHLHSIRHTAITRAIESGMDIREVQKIIDHSSVVVTELYAHDRVKKALKLGLE